MRSRSQASDTANAAGADGMVGDPTLAEEGTDGASASAAVNAPPAAAFLAARRPDDDDDDHDRKVGTVFGTANVPAAGIDGPMVSNAVLAALLLFYFDAERPATNHKEANVLSLQMVAFGCFLSSCCFHGMCAQRGRRAFARLAWAYRSCAQFLSYVGMLLLISSVAVATRIQLGREYGGVWVGSVVVMLMLVLLPVICDMGFCTWMMVESVVDLFYQWKK